MLRLRLLLCTILLTWLALASGQELRLPSGELLHSLTRSVVRVTADVNIHGRRYLMTSSGFVWPDRGYVVTAYHTVAPADSIRVEYFEPIAEESSVFPAVIVKASPEVDLALLAVSRHSGPDSPPPLVASTAGDGAPRLVAILGFPFGVPRPVDSVSFRSTIASPSLVHFLPIHALTSIQALGFPDPASRVLVFDSALAPGHSGAPIVDHDGTVVAIGVGGVSQGGSALSWAVPASELAALLQTRYDGEYFSDPRKQLIRDLLHGDAVGVRVEGATDLAPQLSGIPADESGTTPPDAACVEPVRFESRALEDLVRLQVNAPSGPISCEALARLIVLQGHDMGIESLQGLQGAVGLRVLGASGNGIADLGPIQGLTNLVSLNLYGNPITDLEPIRGLSQLEELQLSGPGIAGVSPIGELRSLRRLTITSGGVTNLLPLENLDGLRILELNYNAISDVSPLRNLIFLESLSLRGNSISSISALSGLTELRGLELDGNMVSDVWPLVELRKLESLSLRKNRVRDLGVLLFLPELKRLDIAGLGLTSSEVIPYLAGLSQLEFLIAAGNELSNVSELKHNTSLQTLWLRDNRISNLNPFLEMPALSWLVLSRNCLRPSDALFADLERLNASVAWVSIDQQRPDHLCD